MRNKRGIYSHRSDEGEKEKTKMYNKGAQGWLKHLDFITLDMMCLQLAFILAYAVRMGSFNPFESEAYACINVIILLADVCVSFLCNTFKNVLKRGYYKELAMTIKHVCLVEAVVIVYLFTIQESVTYSRIIIYLMAVLYVGLGYFPRIMWKKYLQNEMEKTKNQQSLYIVTVREQVESVIQNIRDNSFNQYNIAGIAILDADVEDTELDGIPVVGNKQDVSEAICHAWVDEVLIKLPDNVTFPEELLNQFSRMGLVVHLGLFEASARNGEISGERKQFLERVGNYVVLTTTINYATPMQQFVKRTLDIMGGLIGTLLAGLLVIVIGPIIYIKSPGPIFFKQERVGKNGRRFNIYKFRSMYLDAEERKKELMEQNRCKDGMMFKMDADPRIIGTKIMPDGTVKKGIGNFIRDFSLDEFPQFVNVLKGDMSLVGTRPPTVDEWEKYEPHHRARLAVRPGITGLWQVSGRSSITDFEEVVKLDTKYITEWSMGMDLRILMKTVQVVFDRKGAL